MYEKLREKAYQILKTKYPNFDVNRLRAQVDKLDDLSRISPDDLPDLFHEIQVYQIQLEIQNEELRRVQEELETVKDRYVALYENAPVGYLTLDSSGRIKSVNRMAGAMFGFAPGYLRNKRLSEFVADSSVKHYSLFLNSILNGSDKSQIEIEFMSDASGNSFSALVEAVIEDNNSSDGIEISMTLTDITERVQAKQELQRINSELELRVKERTKELEENNAKLKDEIEERKQVEEQRNRQEERLQAVFQGAREMIWIKDSSLKIIDANPAFEALAHKERSKIIGKRESDVFTKAQAKHSGDVDRRVLNGNEIEFERTIRLDGEEITLLDTRIPLYGSDGTVEGICCVARDITEREQITKKIRKKQTQYRSRAMVETLSQAARIAQTEGIVLLLGESGSGKDYLARWLHDHSHRAPNAYFSINCAALAPELAESELFGHEAGSFTGAGKRKRGLLELSEGGTVLLNEIGELPLRLQSKLLTFLDTRSFVRVGGEKTISVDARLMAATHRDLWSEVEAGRFLEPLFHRLNVFKIEIPPLRRRKEDLPILIDEIFADLAEKMNVTELPVISPSVLLEFQSYHWPGNVRELKNKLERGLMLWDGGAFSLDVQPKGQGAPVWSEELPFPADWNLKDVTDEIKKIMCDQALRRTGGNKKEAAEILGISRDALYRYIKLYGIDTDLFEEEAS